MNNIYRAILTFQFVNDDCEVVEASLYSPTLNSKELLHNFCDELVRNINCVAYVVCFSKDGLNWYYDSPPVISETKKEVEKVIPNPHAIVQK